MEAALAFGRSCFPGCVLEVVLGSKMPLHERKLHFRDQARN
jgi:hypothetical protein